MAANLTIMPDSQELGVSCSGRTAYVTGRAKLSEMRRLLPNVGVNG